MAVLAWIAHIKSRCWPTQPVRMQALIAQEQEMQQEAVSRCCPSASSQPFVCARAEGAMHGHAASDSCMQSQQRGRQRECCHNGVQHSAQHQSSMQPVVTLASQLLLSWPPLVPLQVHSKSRMCV